MTVDLDLPLMLPPGRAEGASYRFAAGELPELARSVTHRDGAYTITLRQGVRNCAGDELSASDVVFALRRAAQASVSSGSWAAWNAAGMLGPLLSGQSPAAALAGSVEVTGRFSLVMRPDPDDGMLPEMLASVATAPLDATLVQAKAGSGDPYGAHWLDEHDAGFGPYCLASYEPGRRVVLSANPHWTLSPRPRLHRVVVEVAPPANELAELEAGRAQVAEGLGATEYLAASAAGHVRVLVDAATTDHLQLDLNFGTAPWGPNGSPRATLMREALAAALPYGAVLAALGGGGATWQGEIPPAVPGAVHDDSMFTTNDTRAAALLADAGHPDGTGLPSSGLVLSYDAVSPAEAAVASAIAQALAKLGITLNLQAVPDATFADGVPRDAMALVTGGETFADAAWYTQRWYAAPVAGGALDLNGYDDPDLNVVVTRATGASGTARAALAAREQAIELADLPVIPLAVLTNRVVVASSVRAMALGGVGAFWAVTSLR